ALLRRRRVLATVWALAAAGGGLIVLATKGGYERERPANPDAAVTEENESFPSGHSMGSLVGYGMVGYAPVLGLRPRWLRWGGALLLAALVLLVGFSRLYLRAHYFSDVLGGYLVGTVWLSACVSALEVLRRRPPRLAPAGTEGGYNGR